MMRALRLAVASCGLLVACSSDKSPTADGPAALDAGADSSSESRKRPAGPAADLSEEITGGTGPFIGAGAGLTVPEGYVEHEYVASGTATAYTAVSDLTADGRWTLAPGGATAEYRTRVIVRRPASAAKTSGTVLVEWLNVSGGVDANPDYASLEEEIIRQGHTWVGVSAQLIGVEGGPVLVKAPGAEAVVGKGLKAIDPPRYGSLSHPGDGYSFDIYTQVARALLEGGASVGGVKPRTLLAVGESQSAFALTTYYDGVQPLTLVFDGFFVHSRGGAGLPLVAPGASADLVGALGSTAKPLFRDDLEAPVLELQAESDVTGILGSVAVRQPESERFRLWEVAGTSHADAHLIGQTASSIDCGVAINNGPMHLVAKAALRALTAWVRGGALPPVAPRVEVSDATPPAVLRDADAIVLGGIRTPPVDVPVDVLSGVPGPNTDVLCILLGSTKPLSDARLAELYASRAAYVQKYGSAADAAITSGFVLEADRAALIAFSQPERIGQ
jgi:hypothetical protein